MRKMWSTAKYRMQCYWKSYTFVMPFFVICVFMRFMYSAKPVEIVSSYLITVYFLFLFMVWIGMTQTNGENKVMEQVIELHVHKTWAYFAGKMLFMFGLSLLVSVVCTVWTFLQNIIYKGTLFDRAYLPADLLNGFLLNLGSACSGAMLGSFLHPDVCRDRKTAIALTALLALLAEIQGILVLTKPVLKCVFFCLPNVALAAVQYGNEEYLKINVSLGYFCMQMVYAAAYGMIGSFWQYSKRK